MGGIGGGRVAAMRRGMGLRDGYTANNIWIIAFGCNCCIVQVVCDVGKRGVIRRIAFGRNWCRLRFGGRFLLAGVVGWVGTFGSLGIGRALLWLRRGRFWRGGGFRSAVGWVGLFGRPGFGGGFGSLVAGRVVG